MNRFFKVLLLGGLMFHSADLFSQDVYSSSRQLWLSKAEALKPSLTETIKHPINMVLLEKDPQAFQGWKVKPVAAAVQLYGASFSKQKSVVLDFGEHMTGFFSFKVDTLVRTPDAPLRFKLTFGEVPSEVATPFDPYNGDLSRAWLQDEIITVMDVPSEIKIARRLAFRYVKIELLGSSQYYDFTITEATCKAVSSVSTTPELLPESVPPIIREIDKVGIHTLKECMQTVYEDGPKRDKRLWLGDLYLESLANTYSFKNHALTKRCLYLLAGLSAPNGYLFGTVFEAPEPHPQAKQFLMDYAFLFNASLQEYVKATGDKETGNDLWPVAQKQLQIIDTYLMKDGMMDFERANKEWWLFFDWKEGLHKQAALQGVSIFALNQTYELAKQLGKEGQVAYIPALVSKMKKAAKKYLYDAKSGNFFSGPDKQVSYASQIWMVLGGVLDKPSAQKALRNTMADKKAVYPGGPYLYHYFIQSLIDAGMAKEARVTLEEYWGGMVKKGADTFWEVYDPADEYLSPYKFFPINSYCHAWSCTPVYFIRKYPAIFQQ